jgi:hypothetical protein
MKTEIILNNETLAVYGFTIPLNENDVVSNKGVYYTVKYKLLNIELNTIYIYIYI